MLMLMLNVNARYGRWGLLRLDAFDQKRRWRKVWPKSSPEMHPDVALPNHVGLAEHNWASSELIYTGFTIAVLATITFWIAA